MNERMKGDPMKRVFSFFKALAVSAFIFYATSPVALFAANAGQDEGAKASPWVFPYISLVLCISLGVAVIGMPTKRDDKPKFDD